MLRRKQRLSLVSSSVDVPEPASAVVSTAKEQQKARTVKDVLKVRCIIVIHLLVSLRNSYSKSNCSVHMQQQWEYKYLIVFNGKISTAKYFCSEDVSTFSYQFQKSSFISLNLSILIFVPKVFFHFPQSLYSHFSSKSLLSFPSISLFSF